MAGIIGQLISSWPFSIPARNTLVFEVSTASSADMIRAQDLPPEYISEIVQMALSDHVSFADIKREYGFDEKHVKALMRETLKSGSYRAWRKRVHDFGTRRETYK